MNYTEVKCSDRLPDKGEYMTNSGWLEFDDEHDQWGFLSGYTGKWEYVNDVIWWLVGFEPPTEEEIKNTIKKYITYRVKIDGNVVLDGLDLAAASVFNLLKGEK